MQIGDVFEVSVTAVEHYGLFVSAGHVRGLILIPDLSWERISHPSEVASVGDLLKCKVIRLMLDEPSDSPQFLASIRDLNPDQDPWRDSSVYAVGNRFVGPIVMHLSYGYFVQHPNGALVLIHADDIAEDAVLAVDSVVTVLISECDIRRQKIRGRLIQG